MSNQNLVAVRYIGSKEVKTDNVSDSGAVWHGNGDVQNVTHAQWGKLSTHKSVWERVTEQPPPSTVDDASLSLKTGAAAQTADTSGGHKEDGDDGAALAKKPADETVETKQAGKKGAK